MKHLTLLLPVLALGLASPGEAQRYVASADTAHPRIIYPDSLLSINDRCIVRMTKLGRRVPPTYVNGRPVGFC